MREAFGEECSVGSPCQRVTQRSLAQLLLKAVALGHVSDDREDRGTALEVLRPGGDLHVDDPAVAQTVAGAHRRIPEAGVPEVDGPLGGVAPDCRNRHLRELLARVSVVGAGGVVDGEETPRLAVYHPHRHGVLVEEPAEQGFAGFEDALALLVDPEHLPEHVQPQGG